ncbi:hypothetical protein [Runella sp.]|jgi:dGTPase|uniref:hypothetical protein n=1 Tax=Runella sp. TaxID=1960881 RepID=UPI00263404A1|nr:hypothetical protein [Runella sp.]
MIDESKDGLVSYKRHPFVYLVEAADDICYNIIDFEDAHRLKILSFETVKDIFLEIIKANPKENLTKVEDNVLILKSDKNECLSYLRAKCINSLTYMCADVFMDNKDEILNGEYDNSLIEDIPEIKSVLQELSKINIESIYNYRKVVELEIAGFRIMSSLVEYFVTSALTPEADREKEQKKILELLPRQFSFEESDTPYLKVMRILDFISGMTDLFALKLYRKLRGIEI